MFSKEKRWGNKNWHKRPNQLWLGREGLRMATKRVPSLWERIRREGGLGNVDFREIGSVIQCRRQSKRREEALAESGGH